MKATRTFFLAGAAILLAACGGGEPAGDAEPAEQAGAAATDTTGSGEIVSSEIVPGLTMRRMREGDGAIAQAGHTAVVHYTGWLYDSEAPDNRGNKFDSSVDRGAHFEFPLGAGRVIRGWDLGVAGMQIGEIRELTIAPDMAYGDRQVGALIPPGSTLVFVVELADLKGLDSDASDTP